MAAGRKPTLPIAAVRNCRHRDRTNRHQWRLNGNHLRQLRLYESRRPSGPHESRHHLWRLHGSHRLLRSRLARKPPPPPIAAAPEATASSDRGSTEATAATKAAAPEATAAATTKPALRRRDIRRKHCNGGCRE